jgi:hypothetical protein
MELTVIMKLLGVFLFIILWFTAFYFLLFHQYVKMKYFKKINDGMKLRVGGKFNYYYLTYPLVKIEFYETNIKIIYSGFTMDLLYNDIIDFKIVAGITEKGLMIKQNKYNFDNEIILYTPFINYIYEYLLKKLNKDVKG